MTIEFLDLPRDERETTGVDGYLMCFCLITEQALKTNPCFKLETYKEMDYAWREGDTVYMTTLGGLEYLHEAQISDPKTAFIINGTFSISDNFPMMSNLEKVANKIESLIERNPKMNYFEHCFVSFVPNAKSEKYSTYSQMVYDAIHKPAIPISAS